MLAVAVAKHLDSLGIVTWSEADPSGDVFIAHMPSEPHAVVGIMPTGGAQQPTKRATDLPTLQTRHRSEPQDPRAALDSWQRTYDALACLDGVWLDHGGPDEVFVIGCTPIQSGPVPIGQDEQDRFEFTGNYEFRTHSPTTHRPA
jgi:hypothetical protein